MILILGYDYNLFYLQNLVIVIFTYLNYLIPFHEANTLFMQLINFALCG